MARLAAETSSPETRGATADDHAAERKPAPATEAARRAAGWPSAHDVAGPAIESDLRAAEALDGPPAEPEGLLDWAAQSAEAEGPKTEDPSTPEDEPFVAEEQLAEAEPPRKGLFARLFGRRRTRTKTAPRPMSRAGTARMRPSRRRRSMPGP